MESESYVDEALVTTVARRIGSELTVALEKQDRRSCRGRGGARTEVRIRGCSLVLTGRELIQRAIGRHQAISGCDMGAVHSVAANHNLQLG